MEELLIEHGAPTLAGLKTANLFTVNMDGEDIVLSLRAANRVLNKKGMKVIPLRRSSSGKTLIYLFRPDRLEDDLSHPEAVCMLKERGYPCGNYGKCIHCLIHHLKEDASFPHEIGLFLGYPPSDVRSFIKSPYEGVKCSGCWQAYSNEIETKKLFDSYKKCTCIYSRKMKDGRSLESLAVRSRKREVFQSSSSATAPWKTGGKDREVVSTHQALTFSQRLC